jgi:hypothetical protein
VCFGLSSKRGASTPAGEPIANGYVFGDAIGRRRRTIKTAWRLCSRWAKILYLHFHDLTAKPGAAG